MPAEIRSKIYGHLLDFHEDVNLPSERDLVNQQPPITRVNRQTRAETLPRYYGTVSVFLVDTESSSEWVGYVKKAVDAFTGGPLGLSNAQSSLRHLDFMMLDFLAKGATGDSRVYVEADLSATSLASLENDAHDPDEIVAVGIPTMDWTDEAAVRAAYDEAATRLEEILTKRLAQAEEHGGHEDDEENESFQRFATSTPEVLRAAVDAMCLFTLACPHLKSVSIYDWAGPDPWAGMTLEEMNAIISPNEVQSTD